MYRTTREPVADLSEQGLKNRVGTSSRQSYLPEYRPDCVSGSMDSPISLWRLTDLSCVNLLPIEATASLTSVIEAGGTVPDITTCCRRGRASEGVWQARTPIQALLIY